MYRCDKCGQSTEAHQELIRKVAVTRYKEYPERKDKRGNIIDEGGDGREIVKELKLCPRCADSF